MGRTPKKKKLSESGSQKSLRSSRNSRCSGEQSPNSAVDKDDPVFIGLALELKEEGTKLFQRRDYEGAAFKFDKAIRILPKGHDDVAFLHCNIAACYMHMNPEEYHRAIDECNSALEASPKYAKALLKRARCFEALDRLDLASRDVQKVLSLEPNNVTALELSESIREVMEEKDVLLDKQVVSPDEPAANLAKARVQRRVSRKFRNSIVEEEVWEMIHDEEDHENDEDHGKEDCSRENHTRNDLSQEENHTGEMQVKHNQEKHTEEIKINYDQHKRGATDEGQQLQLASWDMEEMKLKQRHSQDMHEKHLKEILVKGIQLEKGKCTKQNRVSSVEKRQKPFEVGSHRKQEKHTQDKYERYTNVNQERHSLERHIGHCEDMPEKRITIKTANHGRVKHKKYTGENHEDVREGARNHVKFVLEDDIRVVLIPENCSLLQVMDIARYKYNPHLKSFLLKFMDKEGDLVTITSTEDLRWVEELYSEVPVRLYIKEVSPEREITRDLVMPTSSSAVQERNHYSFSECGSSRKQDEKISCVDDWMMQFARLFKNHVGFDSDACVDLRDLGMRLYYEAMEDTITSEEAQEIFQAAEAKFQEMAALALFNWGNVHMSRARKRLFLSEDASKESILSQLKDAYEWACTEYVKAGKKFEDSVDVKQDFYEGLIALGQQQFEQAKLCWRYADTCKVDMGTEVLELFNHAEDNMEKGMEMWEGIEHLRVKGLSKSRKEKIVLDKLGLNEHGKDLSPDEAFEQASNMRSQLNISWGTILYERSVVEFKLGLSSWEDSLQEAIEKFKTGGASVADIGVMVKNHCVNENTQEGLSFKIDEIIQAWNEMYDAKKLKNGSSSFRLEPLFRRRPSKLHNILEHIHYTCEHVSNIGLGCCTRG
ncbi:HSP-interacting protein-like [Phragmites australis]|uniref:HSP-interacting protein-like n=1 Tax=Phragmites australis TaxID=29695 RepID=UPI002D772BBE|nr:HSP-interacting protein-like [Phragmites australis]